MQDALFFRANPNWNALSSSFVPSGDALAIAWAATVPFVSEKDVSGFPSETIRTLPPDQVVITAIGPRAYTGEQTFPILRDPLDLSQGFCVWDEYEGQPAENVSQCMIDVVVEDRLVNVMVWFGTTKPGDALITAVNDELARLVIPARTEAQM